MANRAQIELTATDRTQAAFASIKAQFAALQSSAVSFQGVLRALGVTFSTGLLAGMSKELISSAAALDDMREITGGTVEGLSKLTDISRIGGHDIGLLETGLVRLTKALAGTDEESDGAGKAFAALNLDVERLKSLSPDKAIEEVAKAFARFEDGAGKTSVALALFGKQGATLLPLLKDIAENSDRVASLTREQAAEAEKLEKAWKTLTVEASNLKRALLVDLAPALTEVLTALRAGGFQGAFDALLGDTGDGAIEKRVAKLRAELDALNLKRGRRQSMLDEDPRKIADRRRQEIAALEAITAARRKAAADDPNSPLFEFANQPALPILDTKKKGGAADKSGENFVRGLREQLAQLNSGELAKLEEKAKQLGVSDTAAPLLEQLRVLKLMPEAIKKVSKEALDQAEAEVESEKALQGVLDKWGAIIDPARAVSAQLREFEKLAPLLESAGLDAQAIRDNLMQAMNEAEFGKPLKDITADLTEQKKIAQELGLTFTSAFEDAVVGSKKAGSAIRALGQDIARIFFRKAVTEPLANKASGIFEAILKKIPGFATGGDFLVGGSGGTDSQLVAFRATPGERVSITPPGAAMGGVSVVQHISIDSRSDAASIRAAMTIAKREAVAAVQASLARGGSLARLAGTA